MTVRSTRSGHDGPKCGGRKKQGGGKCTQTAGWGTNHQGVGRCKLHGGSTHTHIAAAGSAKVEEDAREVLAQLDVAPVEDPLTELAKVAGEVVAWKNAVATQVNKISAMRFLDDKGAEQLRAEVAVWERALDRAVTTLATIAKLNIEERLLALDQRRADMVGDALDRLFDHLGLTPAARKEAGAIVARHLRSVTGGQDRSA